MNDDLRKYLVDRGATAVDPTLLKGYSEAMSREVIPEIVGDSQERDRLAAELRHWPSIAARAAKRT